MKVKVVEFDLSILPDKLRAIVAPDGPVAKRMMLAKAALPMPPDVLIPCLAHLLKDPEYEIAKTARASLQDMPPNTLAGLLASDTTHPAVLDRLAEVFLDNEEFLQKIVLNKVTDDQTLLRLAREAQGATLDLIAQNQARITAFPSLVEALYFNPDTKMSTVSRVLELAVREELPIQNMPGYEEIVASVLGDARFAKKKAHQTSRSEAETPEEKPSAAGEEHDKKLQDLLNAASGESETKTEQEDSSRNLWAALKDMDTSQKIRFAMVGNATARDILIRDSYRLVAVAVLRNPGLSLKEVPRYAAMRSLSDDVLRTIANNKEWVRNYQVKVGLVQNPKTPLQFAMGLLKHLRSKELRVLSRSRDVQRPVARAAKNILSIKR